jgi:hypothetical protein
MTGLEALAMTGLGALMTTGHNKLKAEKGKP